MIRYWRLLDEDATDDVSQDVETESVDTEVDSSPDAPSDDSPSDDSPSPAPSERAAVAPQPPGVRDLIREKYGYDLSRKYQDDDAALEGLVNAMKMAGQRNEDAIRWKQVAPQWEQFEQWRHQQSQPQEQESEDWFQLPEWSEAYNQYITQGEDGSNQFREDTPMEVRRIAEERARKVAEWRHKLYFNPREALKGYGEELKRQIREEVLGEFQQTQQQQQTSQTAASIVQENADWIYQKTGDGRFVIDPDTGQRAMTVAGQMYTQNIARLSQMGVSDPQYLHHYAKEATAAALIRQQQAQGQQAPQQAMSTPNSNAGKTSTKGKVKSQKGLSLTDKLKADLKDIPDDISA